MQVAPGLVIEGAPYRLRQLWHNLLSNTCAYADAPGRLEVRLARCANEAVIEWQDSAPGVPEGDLHRLTERLFRLDASRNRRRGGSGPGLSITSALVTAHGATLTPAPSAQGGFCWTLVFPLAPAPGAQDAFCPLQEKKK